MNGPARILAALALFVALIVLPGCGVSLEGASSAGEAGPVEEVREAAQKQRTSDLPQRPTGVVRIDGKAQGSLTEALLAAYGGSTVNVSFDVTSSDEEQAFDAFCEGKSDIVDSARPISPSEYAACQANGIEPVQFQVASDAAVLAIENETDVGVDCLSLGEVREIFRAASPITSWSQVGYGSPDAAGVGAPAVKVAGPDARSNVFGFFGRFVLGDPEPSPLLLRSDYQAFPTDHGVRLAVAGKRSERVEAERSLESEAVQRDLASALGDAKDAVADAEFQVEKGIADRRSPAEQAADAARLAAAEEQLRGLEADAAEADSRAKADAKAAARVTDRRGTLGLFRFSYYELWEEQLRPMEIEAARADGGPECIFPSQSTVTDATYPLARQLLLTVDYAAMGEAEINDFLSFAVASANRVAIERALVPLPAEVRDSELSWLSGDNAPDVIYYPPSDIVRDKRESR